MLLTLLFAICMENVFGSYPSFASQNDSSLNYDHENENIYEGDGFKVVFCVSSEWDGGYGVQVKIFNTGNEIIYDWNITFCIESDIVNVWNADFVCCDGYNYTFLNSGYNQNIKPGENVEFGFICSGSFVGFPSSFFIEKPVRKVVETDYSVDYCVENEWEEGFIGRITITNNSEETIRNWEMIFKYDREIVSIWNAEIIKHMDNLYVIEDADYNRNILPGESIKVGFCGFAGSDFDVIYDYSLAGNVFAGMGGEISESNLNSELNDDDQYDEEAIFYNTENIADIDKAIADLEIKYHGKDSAMGVTDNVVLADEIYGLPITWKSDNEELLSFTGIVSRPYLESEYVTLTALIGNEDDRRSKTFKIKVVKSINDEVQYDEIETLNSIDDLLLYNYNSEAFNLFINQNGKIDIMAGSISDLRVECDHEARLALYGIRNLLDLDFSNSIIELKNIQYDDDYVVYNYIELYNEIPVEGAFLTLITDVRGNTVALKNGLYDIVLDNSEHCISKDEAGSIITSENAGYEIVDSKKVIFVENGQSKLAWKITYLDCERKCEAYIDSCLGDIIMKRTPDSLGVSGDSKIYSELAEDEFGQKRKIIYLKTSDSKLLSDEINRINIFSGYPASKIESDKIEATEVVSVKDSENNLWDSRAISAYANVRFVQDYYMEKWGKSSIAHSPMNNGYLNLYINVGSDYFSDYTSNAAYISGIDAIAFGNECLGDSKEITMANSLSVVAHEYTHGIVDMLCPNLTVNGYTNETGAINEGYADVMGLLISDSTDWIMSTVGGDIIRDCRSCKDYRELYTTKYGENKYNEKFCHDNSTILSALCFYMMERGIRRESLSRIIKYSLLLGYDSNATFVDVRKNILTAVSLFTNKDLLSETEDIFDSIGLIETEKLNLRIREGKSLVNGIVVGADDSLVENDYAPLKNVSVRLESMDNTYINNYIKTDYLGRFSYKYLGNNDDAEKKLAPGRYKLTFEKQDYKPVVMYIDVDDYRVTYLEKVVMIPMQCTLEGSLRGKIVDAMTGNGVEGVSILIRKGMYDFRGENVTQTSTKKDGIFETGILKADVYTLYIEDKRTGIPDSERFMPVSKAFVLNKELIKNGICAAVTQYLENEQLRIVLEWGNSPSDLDSHLRGYYLNADGTYMEMFEVYYGNRNFNSIDDICDVTLDVDDRNGYGPETITIYDAYCDKYLFYVQNYSEEKDLSSSKAVVKVYFDNDAEYSGRPYYTFTVPADQRGKYWVVFEYFPGKEEKIKPVNYNTDYNPIG